MSITRLNGNEHVPTIAFDFLIFIHLRRRIRVLARARTVCIQFLRNFIDAFFAGRRFYRRLCKDNFKSGKWFAVFKADRRFLMRSCQTFRLL